MPRARRRELAPVMSGVARETKCVTFRRSKTALWSITMPRSSATLKGETFTFRLEPALKAALTRSAEAERIPPGELLRELVRAHLADRERRAFEADARRQSLAIAAQAAEPDGDEAQVMREIESLLDADDIGSAWKG